MFSLNPISPWHCLHQLIIIIDFYASKHRPGHANKNCVLTKSSSIAMVILRITFKAPKNHMLFPRFTNKTKWTFPIIQIYELHRHPVRFCFSMKARESLKRKKWKFLGMRKFTIQFFFIFSFKKNYFSVFHSSSSVLFSFFFLVNIFVVVDIYSKEENRENRAKKERKRKNNQVENSIFQFKIIFHHFCCVWHWHWLAYDCLCLLSIEPKIKL